MTKRQQVVFDLVNQGLMYFEIVERTGLGQRSVINAVREIRKSGIAVQITKQESRNRKPHAFTPRPTNRCKRCLTPITKTSDCTVAACAARNVEMLFHGDGLRRIARFIVAVEKGTMYRHGRDS